MSGIARLLMEVTLAYPDPTGLDHEANTEYLEDLQRRLRAAIAGHDYRLTSLPQATIRHDVVGLG